MKYNYCLGTHPDTPNKSANARGRKYHITLDSKLTLCKNICTKLIGSKNDVYGSDGTKTNGLMWHPAAHDQGMCGNCRIIAKTEAFTSKRYGLLNE